MNGLAGKLIILGGVHSIALIAFHSTFWKLLKWGVELPKLAYPNGAVMQTLNLCLMFFFGIMAYLAFFRREELLSTRLGRTMLYAFALFWLARLIEQFVLFEIRRPAVSAALIILFVVGTALYSVSAYLASREAARANVAG